MCGIIGLIDFDNTPSLAVLNQMLNATRHRGPDGEGLFTKDNIALGHRRLSIIDLEGGKQPLSNANQTRWITYNGEIYNFLELRQQLISFGFEFKTNSDTEVILFAYEYWGKSCLNRLRGMFSFAILDLEKQEFFLARDHFGIKPLVYALNKQVFAFASEIQALKPIQQIDWEINPLAIDQYLTYQYIPAPNTIYKGVKKLPPAHYLRVDLKGNLLEMCKYWELDFRPDYSKNKSYWLEKLESGIQESVNAHLISDVPFGAFLSGGIDSSLVVGMMSKVLKNPVKTFSIGFEEEEFSELAYARKVAEHWGTEHHEAIIKPNALEILPKLVQHYGEPFGDSSAIPTYYVSQLARQHVPMVLSGDAGDELFAGYVSYTTRWTRHHNPIPEHLPKHKKMAYAILNKFAPMKFPLRKSGFTDWKKYIQYFSDKEKSALWKYKHQEDFSHSDDLHLKFWEKTKNYKHFNKTQFSDFNTYLPFDILTKVDIASMMHGLEVRTPLLDLNVVNIACQIPESYNINKESGTWIGKQLLKNIVAKDMGKDFAYRQKMGFAVPLKNWFGDSSRSNKEMESRLMDSGNGLDEWFSKDALQNIARGNQSGQQWLMVFLQEWLSQNKS